EYVVEEFWPGATVDSDEGLLEHARQTGSTTFHQTSTCMMGSHENSVVDSELRVHGMEGLRVVDASVMPTVISGNTNAATIMIAAALLRGWDLGERGFITPYYLAGVRSMLTSCHNLLFNAFDPAGFVSLDKPPVAFWIQTLSAKLLGFSPFSVLLPHLVEGVLAIVLLYALVRRRFGEMAGLCA